MVLMIFRPQGLLPARPAAAREDGRGRRGPEARERARQAMRREALHAHVSCLVPARSALRPPITSAASATP